MHRAICRLIASGVTVAAAAGNESEDAAVWAAPAMYDEVIAVAAMADFDGKTGGLGSCPYPDPDPIQWCLGEVDDTRAFFSNFGTDIDMTAPGVVVETLSPFGFDSEGNHFPYPDGWQVVSGTSYSSPHVAGAAALYKSRHPRATPAQVKAALLRTGTYDYDNSDDPDGIKEPLLNVARF
jgi:subtilisin family serine protease